MPTLFKIIMIFLVNFSYLSNGFPRLLDLSLDKVESQALLNSERLKAIKNEVEAAKHKEDSTYALLWPRLSIDVSYRYISEIPSINFPTSSMAFGDHHNYSFGLVFNWTLFDGGSLWNNWKSTKAIYNAKEEELKFIRRQVLLAARLAYYKIELSIEQMHLVIDYLKLAQAQYKDICKRLKAGSSSRVDQLLAKREMLNLKLQFRQVQSELGMNLRELLALTQPKCDYDISFPIDARLKNEQIEETSNTTLIVKIEPIEKLLSTKKDEFALNTDNYPLVKMMKLQLEAKKKAAAATRSNLWPKLTLLVKSSFDYPNGPHLERIQQNIAGISLSFPIFEWSKTRNEAIEKELLAEASERQKKLTEIETLKDFHKARDLLISLRSQTDILSQAAKETEELSKLTYSSWLTGRASYLEVQSANLKALESKVQLARNNVQILIQLAILNSFLSGE